jgi:hypothetical protein
MSLLVNRNESLMLIFVDSDFENVIKADPDRNMSYSASVCSFSREHRLLFQFLGPCRATFLHMKMMAPSDLFQAGAIQSEEEKPFST